MEQNMMQEEKKNYVVAIDLGSANVVVALGTIEAQGVDVKYTVSRPIGAGGMKEGRIENIELVSSAITEAVEELQEQTGLRVTEAYAGISGSFVRCARHTDYVFTEDPDMLVVKKDVSRLNDRMTNVQAPDVEQIMERTPLYFRIDNGPEQTKPIGQFGRKLYATYNFILCAHTPIQRLGLALKRCNIILKGVIVNSQAIAEAVIRPEEREEGVAVVDMGGELTDVAVYYHGVLRYVATIPLGSRAINADIQTMSIPEKHLEPLKRKYGVAVAELAPRKYLRVQTGKNRTTDILLCNLAMVIESRLAEIAEFVMQEIQDSGCPDKIDNLVLTGGATRLTAYDEFFRRKTGCEVRIGVPERDMITAESKDFAIPENATIAGLLVKGARIGACVCAPLPGWQKRREEEAERLRQEQAAREAAAQARADADRAKNRPQPETPAAATPESSTSEAPKPDGASNPVTANPTTANPAASRPVTSGSATPGHTASQPAEPQTLNDFLGSRKEPERRTAQADRTPAAQTSATSAAADEDGEPLQTPAEPAEVTESRGKDKNTATGHSDAEPVIDNPSDNPDGPKRGFVRWMKDHLASISKSFESTEEGDDII